MKRPIIDFQVLSYSAGDVIFQEGDSGDELFVVRDGEVAVKVRDAVVETLGASEIFGEMALVDGKPRSATVVAQTDCVLVPIREKQFLLMIGEAPYFALAVMRVLVQRLREANAQL